RARALGRLDDLRRRLVQNLVVERLEADADALSSHSLFSSGRSERRRILARGGERAPRLSYLLRDRSDDAGADGAAALADGEAEAFFDGDRGDQLDLHL